MASRFYLDGDRHDTSLDFNLEEIEMNPGVGAALFAAVTMLIMLYIAHRQNDDDDKSDD